MTDPGRLNSLGTEYDLIDAQGLLEVAQACHELRERWHAGTTHVMKEALWSFWERPRLGATVDGKYPTRFPWSPQARARYEAHAGRRPLGGWQLVYEHVRPLGLIVGGLIDLSSRLTAEDVVAMLNRVMAGAVITKVEDRILFDAGVGRVPIDQTDENPWARYVTAGIDTDAFAPLDGGS